MNKLSLSGIAVIRSQALWISTINGHDYTLKLRNDIFEIWRDEFLVATYSEKLKKWFVEPANHETYFIDWPMFSTIAKSIEEKLNGN